MNAKITQGKRQLWQWDTGVQLMLFDIGTANEVHFATPDGVIRRDIVNNMCNIPDVVLQRAGTMVCYVFNREPYEGDTRHEFHFDVLPRPKPADYIDPPDEADYIDLIAERAAKALPLFIVHVERVDGVLRADKTPAEISEALNARRVCMLLYGDAVLNFYGWRDGNPAFAGVPFKAFSTAHGAHYVHDFVVLDDGTVDATISEVNGLTAYPLVFEGGVEASYNGSKETRINISNVVNNALTVAKESGDFKGDPGTSVTITNITQSTEDDGYSVVTFSDGKQLRVKNGSKGSAGEGGEGGGVVTVYCQPSEDMQSFTASMTVEEIRTAVEEHKAVQSFVLGMDIVAHAFMVTEDVVLFSAVASFAGESMAVTLNMMADGTNAMIVTALGGMCVVNITTSDNGMTGTADMTGPQLFEAVSMGQPVYANFNGGMYAPAQLVDANAAAFKIELSGGTIMATIDDQGTVTLELAENSGAGGNVVAVTLAYEGNTIKPSHTSSEIYNLVTAGNTVLLQYGGATCTANLIGESECVFEHMGYSAAGDQMTFGDYMTITIAGDVVTLKDHMSQRAYPNPHPLVINGVSYDGSKRVEIKEGKWELIESLKIEDDETKIIERTAWPDGKPYSLKALSVIVRIPYPIASQIGVTLLPYSNGTELATLAANAASNSNTNSNLKHSLLFKAIPNFGVYEFISASGNNGGLMEMFYPANGSGENKKAEQYIDKFKMNVWTPNALNNGSTIEIWGVGADA